MAHIDETNAGKPHIYGWTAHPDIDALKAAHSDAPPLGITTAVLTNRAWGESQNLLLYFETAEAGEPIRRFTLSVWWNDEYRPKQHGPSFRDPPLGRPFVLAIRTTRNGTFTLDYAKETALAAA